VRAGSFRHGCLDEKRLPVVKPAARSSGVVGEEKKPAPLQSASVSGAG